jgi:hypothetical protein
MGGLPGAMPGAGGAGSPADIHGASSVHNAAAAPKDLKGKLLHAFEHSLMPIFYSLNLKHEWRVIAVVAFGVFAVGNLVVSVYPLLEQNRTALIHEMGRRAQLMARQIAERNGPALAARAETKTEVGSFESAEGVRVWDAKTGACHALLAPAPAAAGGQEEVAAWALDVLERRPHAASGR